LSNNAETCWINGEPFALVFTADGSVAKPNTEKYWFSGQALFELLELAPDPYTPPYVPPTPTPSFYGAETFWVNGAPSMQFFPNPIPDTTPPVFLGIGSLTVGLYGELSVGWPAATDASFPLTYQVYVQKNTATNLFNPVNVALSTSKTFGSIFVKADGTFLDAGIYYVGVRVYDSFGNQNVNTVVLSANTNGVLIPVEEGGPIYEPRAVFSINASNQLQGTLWCAKDGQLVTSNLGTASFTIYDKDGVSIGISQSGLTADINGYFETTLVSAAPILDLTHYTVKIVIDAFSVPRVGTVGLTLGE
jgi:hypothetical protein